MTLKHLVLLAAAALFPALVHAADLGGTASVVDGDTIVMGNTRIRLHGIDAPETDQVCTTRTGQRWQCGEQAALALAARLGRRRIFCEQRDIDQYGRVVAECFVGSQSINRWMVRSGWAVAYTQFTRAYVMDERLARLDRKNIWSGNFQQPADHRRDGRTQAARSTGTTPPDPACPIKGNINRRGDRIYHEPGQASYALTVIDTSAGERWFCSADQARAAGWRPATDGYQRRTR